MLSEEDVSRGELMDSLDPSQIVFAALLYFFLYTHASSKGPCTVYLYIHFCWRIISSCSTYTAVIWILFFHGNLVSKVLWICIKFIKDSVDASAATLNFRFT
jgi:hypothetical protein